MADIMRYQRVWPLTGIEISRAHADGRTVDAYAAMFDDPYEVKDQHGHYMERIDRSAFNRTLSAPNALSRVMCLYNHGLTVHGTPSDAYGVPIGNPLEVRPDARGLRTLTRYNKGADADRILEAIDNGAIRAQSFRGRIVRSTPNGRLPRTNSGALPVVTRHELGLADYGPTPVPVNVGAAIMAVRAGGDDWATAVATYLSDDERDVLLRGLGGGHPSSLIDVLSGLDEDQRGDLIEAVRALSPTTDCGCSHSEASTATPEQGPGAEDPPTDGHSGRLTIRRNLLRMQMLSKGVLSHHG